MNRIDILLTEIKRSAKNKGLKIEDIAKGTGLNKSTVSLILNNKKYSATSLNKVINFIEQEINIKDFSKK